MSTSSVPIPPSIWQRILEFLADGGSGKIELDIKDGRVQRITIAKSWRSTG